MTDPDGIALLIVMGVIGIALLLGAAFVERLVEPRKRRFHQRDHVAEAKRRITRNAFKTRAGIRQ